MLCFTYEKIYTHSKLLLNSDIYKLSALMCYWSAVLKYCSISSILYMHIVTAQSNMHLHMLIRYTKMNTFTSHPFLINIIYFLLYRESHTCKFSILIIKTLAYPVNLLSHALVTDLSTEQVRESQNNRYSTHFKEIHNFNSLLTWQHKQEKNCFLASGRTNDMVEK